MPSATDFLPLCITMLMKREISWLPCLGSGSSSRVGVLPLRDIRLFSMMRSIGPLDTQARVLYSERACEIKLARLGLLRAVLRAALLALGDAGRIERTAHRVVTHARQVLYTTAADQHDRVLLQVVAFAADVADDFETVGQTHLGDLAQSRVRLLRRGRINARAHTATLRAVLKRRRSALVGLRAARLAHQLIDGRHSLGIRGRGCDRPDRESKTTVLAAWFLRRKNRPGKNPAC